MHVLLHPRCMTGLEFLHRGLLVGGEHLEQLVVDTRPLYGQFDLGLRLLGRQGPDFALVVGAFCILAELVLDLPPDTSERTLVAPNESSWATMAFNTAKAATSKRKRMDFTCNS